jgi:hypothetical protein
MNAPIASAAMKIGISCNEDDLRFGAVKGEVKEYEVAEEGRRPTIKTLGGAR